MSTNSAINSAASLAPTWRWLSAAGVALGFLSSPVVGLATSSFAQTGQSAVERPPPGTADEPVETPIGTEANTPIPEIAAVRPLQRRPASITLKVGTWNLKALRPGETKPPELSPAPKTKKWRHTFGAERRTAQWRNVESGGFGADIVALQGVESVRTVRRLYPVRHYYMIASRQLLMRSTATGVGATVTRSDPPATTAIAVRRRGRSTRVSGLRHFLPPSERQASGEEPIAVTALRLRIHGNILWIASADTAAHCRAEPSATDCKDQMSIFSRFVDWARERLSSQKARLILLGQWPEGIAEQLRKAGFMRQGNLASDVACTPAPSPMQVFASTPNSTKTSELDNAETVKANACATTADLTLQLR